MYENELKYFYASWDNEQGDLQNALNLLQKYVTEPTISNYFFKSIGLNNLSSYFWGSTSQEPDNQRILDVKKALDYFKQLKPTHGVKLTTRELIACLKQAIHTYKPYKFILLDNHTQYDYKPKSDEFVITKFRNSFINYKVLTPNNKIEEGVVDTRYFTPFPTSTTTTLEELFIYNDQIFEFTSRIGNTAGPHIKATDDLAKILQVFNDKSGVDYFDLDYKEILENFNNLHRLVNLAYLSSWKKQNYFTQQINELGSQSLSYINTTNTDKIISALHITRYKNGKLAFRVKFANFMHYGQFKNLILTHDLPMPADCYITGKVLDKTNLKCCYRVNDYVFVVDGTLATQNFLLYHDELGRPWEVKINDYAKFQDFFPWNSLPGSEFKMEPIFLTSSMMDNFIPLVNHSPLAYGCSEANEYILYAPDSYAASLNHFVRLLNILQQLDASITPVMDDMIETLTIHHLQQAEFDLIAAINNAITMQNQGQYSLLWNLAMSCKEDFFAHEPKKNISLDRLMLIFESVAIESPFYRKANDELCGLSICNHPYGKINRQLQEQMFRYAFKGSNQILTDNLYNDLCGYGLSADKITGIKGDEDVLIALAKKLSVANAKPYNSGSNPHTLFKSKITEFKQNDEHTKDVVSSCLA